MSHYNQELGRGVVRYPDRTILGFKSVAFASGRPPRFPEVGDEVQVILDGEGAMILVRLKDSQ